MNRNIKGAYFEWMLEQINAPRKYRRLMSYLNGRDFIYTIGLDGNRADDGINMRYSFGEAKRIPQPIIASELDCNSCSILEMMVALSIRFEEHIMCNDDRGCRTSRWFFEMIDNLGLGSMTNDAFDYGRADYIIDRFLNHEYSKNGEGGLFTVECGRDMRTTEIWYQMCWYSKTIIRKDEQNE